MSDRKIHRQTILGRYSRGMLNPLDRRILDFERAWWLLPEPKDRTILEVLGIGAADYYDHLRRIVQTPQAETYDPMTVRRLRRVLALGA